MRLEGLDPAQITGSGGLITQLAGRVINAALEAEMDGHLGRPAGTPAMDGNHRTGSIARRWQPSSATSRGSA